MVMATYDNKHWLLSHIRHSFISTDDTGMCEIVMLGEDFPKQMYNMSLKERKKKKDRNSGDGQTSEGVNVSEETEDDDLTNAFHYVTEYDPYPEMEESDGDDMDLLAESYDIRCDMDFAPYRQRSNTAQRLEKMEQALKKASKVKIVKWENPPNPLTNEERAQIFVRKDLSTSTKNIVAVTKKRSLLSDQLAKCSFYPHSQYLEYARFDGTAMLGVPTKSFKIFMTMLPEEQRNYPLTVCVVASAKVQDVIGFTCYKYSVEQPSVILGPAASYGLFIAEDDGEMDWAFPCLDANEPCSKFGLTHLGLVELKSKNANKPPEITCSIPEGGAVLTIEEFKNTDLVPRSRSATVDSKDKRLLTEISLGNNQADSGKKDRRALVAKPAVTFDDAKARRDEKTKTLSVLVDRLPKRLTHSYGDSHAESSASGRLQQREALALMQTHHQVLEAPQYQSFAVQLCHRVRTNTPVLLGISGQRIEIDPRNSVSPKFWTRMKPVSYSMDMVAWCEIVEARSSKTTFRLVYSTGHGPSSHENSIGHQHLLAPSVSFKHHDLECEHALAKEIVEKINRILELRMSACRREYKAARDRKLQARRSFHLQRQS